MAIELTVPTVGESITEVEIGTWLKQPGDAVNKDEPLVEIESDKATVEVFAPEAGTLKEIVKATGETAQIGDLIGYFEPGKSNGHPKQPAKTEPEPAPKSKKPEQKEVRSAAATASIMPAADRLLAKHGLDAKDVPATGPGGRLLKEDVQAHAKKKPAAPAPQKVPASPAGDREEEVVRMTPLRRAAAQHLLHAQQSMALLTTFNECDMSAVMAMRESYKDAYDKQYGIKLGFMSFFVKAVIEGLKEFPAVNAEIRGEEIAYKNYYDIGIAVSGKKGLVVPIIRNAERMSFGEIELAIADMGKRAREGKVHPDELTGGTFTITNGGIFGSMMSTPIVNPPQSAILGMHNITKRAVVIKDEIVIRPMMYVALTYDHRIIDGREAVSFLVRVKECIEDPTRILLEI